MRAWRAADLASDRSWHQHWNQAELAALHAWAGAVDFDALAAQPASLNAVVDEAPTVISDRASAIRHELINGRGLCVVSGLDTAGLAPREAAVVFLCFASLLGSLRSQNAAGHLLGHVTDVGADINDPTTRIYQTNHRQTFHTDSSDAVGLLCLRTAQSGGESLVVNVEAVYERMAHEAPELAARLFDPVATDRRGEEPPGELSWFEIPVLNRSGDRLTCIYQRQYIDSARRFPDAPVPDAQHVAALDLFDEIMNDPAMHVRMAFAPGDMQFVHNHSVLHDRTGFADHAEPERRRHLLRVWMSLPNDRELPAVFAQRYGSITVGDRGGIFVEDTKPTIEFPAPLAG